MSNAILAASSYERSHGEELSVEEIKQTFRRFQAGEVPVTWDTNNELDALLGLQPHKTDNTIRSALRESGLPDKYEHEETWLGGGYIFTDYGHIKAMVDDLRLGHDDVVYDLGSGYGRVPLYIALTTPAKAKGIELVSERAQAAQQAQRRLGLENTELIEGNVLDHDFTDGTIFYMFNPFSTGTFYQVRERLREIARTKPITVVTWANHMFHGTDWLELQEQPTGLHRTIDVFKSRPVPAAPKVRRWFLSREVE